MTECGLFEDAGKRHFITERFDRENGKKIHMQTFGALMHLDYNQPRSSGYEALADCAHRLKIGKDGIDQIFRRMVFNVVAMNNDDHVKNFSFLMDRTGKWRLSPAYDLTFSYNPENFWLREHQMTINGKSKNISYDDLMQCGKTMGLSKRKIDSIINEVIVAASNWSHLAYSFNLNSKAIEYIDTLITDQISRLLTQE